MKEVCCIEFVFSAYPSDAYNSTLPASISSIDWRNHRIMWILKNVIKMSREWWQQQTTCSWILTSPADDPNELLSRSTSLCVDMSSSSSMLNLSRRSSSACDTDLARIFSASRKIKDIVRQGKTVHSWKEASQPLLSAILNSDGDGDSWRLDRFG